MYISMSILSYLYLAEGALPRTTHRTKVTIFPLPTQAIIHRKLLIISRQQSTEPKEMKPPSLYASNPNFGAFDMQDRVLLVTFKDIEVN